MQEAVCGERERLEKATRKLLTVAGPSWPEAMANLRTERRTAEEALAQDAQRVEEFFQVRSEANTAAIAEPTDLAEASHVANTQANDSHLKQILQIK